jgi:hypothetical protein
MRIVRHPPSRNAIDLTDAEQVRALTKRLRISADELARIIETSGNSITAITKEVERAALSGSGDPSAS